MEENQTPTSPIAGEPALLEALSAVDTLIDMKANPQRYHSYELEEQHQEASLKDLRWWMQKAIDAMRSEPVEDEALLNPDNRQFNPLTPVAELIEVSDRIDDAEGEMRAEAEAERQADAALELAAELASCDWEGWN